MSQTMLSFDRAINSMVSATTTNFGFPEITELQIYFNDISVMTENLQQSEWL